MSGSESAWFVLALVEAVALALVAIFSHLRAHLTFKTITKFVDRERRDLVEIMRGRPLTTDVRMVALDDDSAAAIKKAEENEDDDDLAAALSNE